jgi:hypothetical protein
LRGQHGAVLKVGYQTLRPLSLSVTTTISRAQPRATRAVKHAEPAAPAAIIPTFISPSSRVPLT